MADTELKAHLDDCRRYPSRWDREETASLAWRALQRIEELEAERAKPVLHERIRGGELYVCGDHLVYRVEVLSKAEEVGDG